MSIRIQIANEITAAKKNNQTCANCGLSKVEFHAEFNWLTETYKNIQVSVNSDKEVTGFEVYLKISI